LILTKYYNIAKSAERFCNIKVQQHVLYYMCGPLWKCHHGLHTPAYIKNVEI